MFRILTIDASPPYTNFHQLQLMLKMWPDCSKVSFALKSFVYPVIYLKSMWWLLKKTHLSTNSCYSILVRDFPFVTKITSVISSFLYIFNYIWQRNCKATRMEAHYKNEDPLWKWRPFYLTLLLFFFIHCNINLSCRYLTMLLKIKIRQL